MIPLRPSSMIKPIFPPSAEATGDDRYARCRIHGHKLIGFATAPGKKASRAKDCLWCPLSFSEQNGWHERA